jgi:hypothetical protein
LIITENRGFCNFRVFSENHCSLLNVKIRDSAVFIATGYGLDDKGFGVRVPVWQEFSLLHVVQIGSGAHPAFYPNVSQERYR